MLRMTGQGQVFQGALQSFLVPLDRQIDSDLGQ